MPAKTANVTHKAILFPINKRYRNNMSPGELYEATRNAWHLKPKKRDQAEFAMAVRKKIILEVYKIKEWHEAKTNNSKWEFEGEVATVDVRDKYIDLYVPDSLRSYGTVRYANIL